MISNDEELKVTQERISRFQSLLMQMRVTATKDEFPYVSSNYRKEIEQMQREVLDYLTRHISEAAVAAT